MLPITIRPYVVTERSPLPNGTFYEFQRPVADWQEIMLDGNCRLGYVTGKTPGSPISLIRSYSDAMATEIKAGVDVILGGSSPVNQPPLPAPQDEGEDEEGEDDG